MSYTSKDVKTLEGIEAIRMRPAMYIGGTDFHGLHHLLLEAVSNSIDEALNGYGNHIIISINTKTNQVDIRDFGRGIPFGKTEKGTEAMIDIATSLHSGGKFGQGGYPVSGGLHGIGLTAINALSSEFIISSYRDGESGNLIAKQGKIIDYTVKKTKEKNGTLIQFIPDKEIFSKSTWSIFDIEEMLRMLSFLSVGIKFTLKVDGKEIDSFESKDGLKDLILYETKGVECLTDVIYINTEINDINVEIAMRYLKDNREIMSAFTNNIPNRDGGTHITGFRSSLTQVINTKARELGLLNGEDSNFSGEMVRQGLIYAVSIKMKETPMFTNQTKDKLQSPNARAATSQAVAQINFSRKDLDTIIKRALTEKRAEDAAKRAREAAKKVVSGGRNMNMLKDLPEKLKDANKPNGELFLVEGDSAGGSAETARDPQTQAILPLRGKVLNTFNKELSDIVDNKEIKDILTTLGCGVGANFNIKNLRYDKIILLADADPDGQHINVLLMTIFLKHLPQLIEAGKIYQALPPLYKVKKGKKTIFIQNDQELEKYIKKNGQPSEITRFKGLGEQDPEELWETTLNPETRTLIQLTTDNIEKSIELFDILMGNDSVKRREYILANTKKGVLQ